MDIELVIIQDQTGARQNMRLMLVDRIVVGRDPDCTVPLDGKGISRNHFLIEADSAQRVSITDVSNNGTWVNGARLPRNDRRSLSHGDQITFPGYAVQFLLVAAAAPAASAAAAVTLSGTRSPQQTANLHSMSDAAPASGNPITGFLNSFSGYEKFLILSSIAALVMAYRVLTF